MRAQAISLFLAVLAIPVISPALKAEDKPVELKMGMVQGMFRDVPPAMVQALSKPFRELVFKQTGFGGDVEICSEALCLADKLQAKQLHIGVFHGFEFAWAQKRCPELVPIVVTLPPGGKVQAMLVVNAECKFKTPNELTDETVWIPRGAKAHSLAFFEKARAGFPKTTAKPVYKTTMTAEDVLNAVAAGEQVAALVDHTSLEGYATLQPGAAKLLKVMQLSEAFPPAVVAYRKGTLTEDDAEKIRKGLSGAHETTSGKMLMTLWNLKGMEVPPADYQQKLDTILKAYPLPDVK
jgi:hypothetical protein